MTFSCKYFFQVLISTAELTKSLSVSPPTGFFSKAQRGVDRSSGCAASIKVYMPVSTQVFGEKIPAAPVNLSQSLILTHGDPKKSFLMSLFKSQYLYNICILGRNF